MFIASMFSISCNKQPGFIELEQFTSNLDGQYFYRILIENPPSRRDSLKNQMVRFYKKKQDSLYKIDSSYTIGSILFYNKTRCTSYFINNKENHTGFFTDVLDDCNDIIGTISVDHLCGNQGTLDWILLYEKNSTGITRIETDTLFYNCNEDYINRWHEYK